MEVVSPTGLTGDSLVYHYRIALKTARELHEVAQTSDEIELDLSDAEWFAPTFLAPTSVIYNQLEQAGVDISIRYPDDYRVKRYLKMIDFPSGTATPSKEYTNTLPLCLMNTSREEDVIDIIASKMRELIKNEFLSESGNSMWLNYPLGEVIDNVDVHSRCDYGTLLIQNYPSKEALDLCIADDGISIPGNYERSDIDFDNDVEAVRMAMEDGVSTREGDGGQRGFGLRTTVEMICDGLDGQVFLSSRGGSLFRNQNSGPYKRFGNSRWGGTVFAARLYPPEEDFSYLGYITPDS